MVTLVGSPEPSDQFDYEAAAAQYREGHGRATAEVANVLRLAGGLQKRNG